MELASVVLAAGSGIRLRPLTDLRPKALCPVANVALVDHAITALRRAAGEAVAVNVWHHRRQMQAHLEGRVHLSVEDEPLGTAGGLGALRSWIDGRPVLVHNADARPEKADLSAFAESWDGERVRLLVTHDPARGDFGPWRFCGVSLLPWSLVAGLRAEPSGLWEVSWAELASTGSLDLVPHDGPYVDCGNPADYLAANLLVAGKGVRNVVGRGARVDGDIDLCVIWPGASVGADERLVEVIRTETGLTVSARLEVEVARSR